MSGITIFRDEDFVAILTDGANWDFDEEAEQYKVTHFHSKVEMFPHINAVLVSQGAGDFLPLLRYNHDRYWTSFDVLLDRITGDIEANLAHLKKLYPQRRIAVRIYVSGWSDVRKRFETYEVFVDVDGAVKPLEPIEKFTFNPIPDEAAYKAVGFVADDKGEINLNGQNATYLFMQAQRMTKIPMGARDNPPEGYCVGGFIQETILRRDRIETKIAHRWIGDLIGEAITPKPGEVEEMIASFKAKEMAHSQGSPPAQ